MPLFFKRSGAVFALLVAAGCNRAPEEPRPDPQPAATSATSATSAVSASVASASPPAPPQKCVAQLPAVAPPTPAPAGVRCPSDPTGPFKLARARVTFPEAGVSVDAELARSDAESERGLMYRKSMGEDEGMFFFLGDRKVQTFWMHNTCIPLDMIFIDDDGTIVGVVEDAPVLDDEIRAVPCPSRFVLEVNAGWTRRHHVRPGQRVVVPS